MVLKVYCDTNIFIDYFDERSDRLRPLKDFAFEFFSRGWNCSFELIVSDWLLTELKQNLEEKQINEIFNRFKEKNKLILIKEEKGDRDKARKISEHWQDPLHAILANKSQADYLATRNIKDFSDCEKLVKIVFPEFI